MSDELQDLKRGDAIVRFGVVHRITKVDTIKLKTDQGTQTEKIIYFQPKYKNRRNDTLKLSIPLGNLDKTTIRLPINKTAMKEELKFLRQPKFEKTPFNRIKVKRIISDNQLHELARVLKTLWEEKRDENKNFTISKRNTFKMAMTRFQQEVAYVLDISLAAAEEKIETALDTGWSRQLKLRRSLSAQAKGDADTT